jgi:uncharacterized protein (TIGR00266 family)
MQDRVVGTTMPVLEMQLDPGEAIIAEAGELSWMTNTIQLKTVARTSGQGFMGIVRRVAGGGGLFMTEYTAAGRQGMVAFATKMPGHIRPVALQPGRGYLVHRHGFLCATLGVELSMGFQRQLGAGVFGGTGFVLQKVAGSGQAWIELDGEVVEYELAAGESLRVHPGHVGLFEEQVSFDITTVPGIRNVLFGGDGLFLAQLTGPGKVWLQTLPLPNLAHALSPYLGTHAESAPSQSGGNLAAGVMGGVLGGLLGGNNHD